MITLVASVGAVSNVTAQMDGLWAFFALIYRRCKGPDDAFESSVDGFRVAVRVRCSGDCEFFHWVALIASRGIRLFPSFIFLSAACSVLVTLVFSGDPNLPIDVVGVPKSIAMTLTYPEFVTHLNINKLKELVKKGPLEWPGAKYVIREDGTR